MQNKVSVLYVNLIWDAEALLQHSGGERERKCYKWVLVHFIQSRPVTGAGEAKEQRAGSLLTSTKKPDA